MSCEYTRTDDQLEVVQLTNEALALASAACHFDQQQNVVGACDYYDKCILNIDEVLNKLKPDSAEWTKLWEIRSKYDDRMETLRDLETSKYSLQSLALGANASEYGDLADGSSKGGNALVNKHSRRRRMLFKDETNFTEADGKSRSMDEAPINLTEIPYWFLRNVKMTIDQGGFLTEDIFIPKKVWLQNDVKFSGHGAKTAAFDIIIKLIVNHVETLYQSVDEDSLDLAHSSLANVCAELTTLQNQLAKPFPFIKELSVSKKISGDDTTKVLPSNSLVAPVTPASTPIVASSMKGNHTSSNNTNGTSDTALATNITVINSGTTNGPHSSSSNSNSKSLTHFVSSLSKNVRKYAEVGYQRLVVALPAKLSTDELADYTVLISTLCDKCQLLDHWYQFLKAIKLQSSSCSPSSESARPQVTSVGVTSGRNLSPQQVDLEGKETPAVAIDNPVRTDKPPPVPPRPVAVHSNVSGKPKLSVSTAQLSAKQLEENEEDIVLQEKVDCILLCLLTIAASVRDIICELLLRDIDYLLEKYLQDMRKSFSRMYWDDEVEAGGFDS